MTWFAVALGALARAQSTTPLQGLGQGRGTPPRAVYVSDEAQNDVFELYGVPQDGSGPPVLLNDALPTGGDVLGPSGSLFRTVSGERVVYVADQLTNDVFELFVVSTDGSSAPLRLSAPMATGGDVSDFQVAGQRVVYRADGTVDERRELYAVPVDGSAPGVPLTPGLNTSRLLALTADGSQALFATLLVDREEMWVVPTDGSAPPMLLADAGEPTSFFAVPLFVTVELGPDEQHVFYSSLEDDDSTPLADFHAVRLDGSAPPVHLNPGPRYLGPPRFQVSPDGTRVLFLGTPEDGSPVRLYTIHPDGSGLNELSPGTFVTSFCISRDSAFAAIASRASPSSGPTQLALVNIGGSTPLPLLPPSADAIELLDFAPAGGPLVYATIDSAGRRRLFSLATPNVPVSLIGDPPPGQGIEFNRTTFDPTPASKPVITRDGKRIVFRGDLTTDEVHGVYSVRLDGSEPVHELSPPLAGPKEVFSFRLTDDQRTVLFRVDPLVVGRFELRSAPIDGSRPSIRLSNPAVFGGAVVAHLPGARPTGSKVEAGP